MSTRTVRVVSLNVAPARAESDLTLGARPAKATAHASTARPVEVSSANARPCPFGAESPGASAPGLVMQTLAQRLEREHQLSAVRHRRAQRVNRRAARRLPGALASEPDQRRAIAIIGLEPSRAQLRSRRLRLRRREHP